MQTVCLRRGFTGLKYVMPLFRSMGTIQVMKIVPSTAFAAGAFLLYCASDIRAAESASIRVDTAKPGHAVSPHLWGLFFEDINLSADGGLYAELLRNRSFEDSEKPEHWQLVERGGGKGRIAVTDERPMAAEPGKSLNRRSLRIEVSESGAGSVVGVANGGYWGVPAKAGESYRLSLAARAEGGIKALTVALESADGKPLGSAQQVAGVGADWKTFNAKLAATVTDTKARLVITASGEGKVWLDMVSLFPEKTWKGRENGMRPDLAEMLVGLYPKFLRFPGGCWVEGNTMAESYRWKQTIGPLHERRTQWNIWGYWATHGLGYHEYLQLAEDLGAEPLFCINVGMSHRENVPMEKMDEYVQDALDALEYANGPATSRWGSLRAKNGHPKPFNMKYMEIGNENGGPPYNERWPLFHKAIKAKYPDVKLIANHWAGGYPSKPAPDLVDEHYYSTPEFFIREAGKYDNYDRKGPKVFVGEYAVTQNTGTGSLRGAIGEAAFMTGLERNSDVVSMACYAPLFVHVNHRRWNPDLINFDNTRAYGLPSYYVQRMFAADPGTRVLPTTVDAAEAPLPLPSGPVGVGTWNTQAEFKDIKVVKDGRVIYQSDFTAGKGGWKMAGGKWETADGVLRQTAGGENVRAIAEGVDCSGCVYSLKARKTGGDEGFLILFGMTEHGAKSWWNLGGWGNQRHAFELGGEESGGSRGRIETGKWYDIVVDTSGGRLKCSLDGKQLVDIVPPRIKSVFASATLDEPTGDIIVKIVNAAPDAREAVVELSGLGKATVAKALQLSSANPMDENSLDEPLKVSPKPVTPAVEGNRIRHTMPGNSLVVVRLKR